jgi:hypothetical protein
MPPIKSRNREQLEEFMGCLVCYKLKQLKPFTCNLMCNHSRKIETMKRATIITPRDNSGYNDVRRQGYQNIISKAPRSCQIRELLEYVHDNILISKAPQILSQCD